VIGAWRLGKNVTVFQNVTLGAKSIDMGFDPRLRPDVGDDVTFGAGSKILGGISIGDNVTVGSNAVVLASVAPNSIAVGIPARVVPRETLNGAPPQQRPNAIETEP
jgi:serine O-acetyltransferase